MFLRFFILFAIPQFFFLYHSTAQSDSLVFKDNRHLVGEIKSMQRGVLLMKTDFSKEDFKVKWNEIKEVYSNSMFIVSSKSRSRQYGTLSSPENGMLKITVVRDEEEIIYPIEEIIYIKSRDDKFLDRISAGIDFGFTLTRARNQRQLSTRSRLGYYDERWSFDASFNKLVTAQDEIEDIVRGDGNLTGIYYNQKAAFTIARIEYLYNTEQLLDLRVNSLLGLGKDAVRSNAVYWRLFGGLAFNNENYVGETMDRQSAEAWVASELNIFDVGDFNLLTNVFVYPSITERGRIRVDYRIDLKYDLPLDFYVKTGVTLNYDNQPFQTASRSDYILQTTFGWSW